MVSVVGFLMVSVAAGNDFLWFPSRNVLFFVVSVAEHLFMVSVPERFLMVSVLAATSEG